MSSNKQPPFRGYISDRVDRLPQDSRVDVTEIDMLIFSAVEYIANRFIQSCNDESVFIVGQLMKSMISTHKSVRVILSRELEDSMGMAGDVLPLARTQIEKTFIAMLLKHDSSRYLPIYKKEQWRVLAFSELTERHQVHDLLTDEQLNERDRGLRDHAVSMGVTQNEIETTIAKILGGTPDPSVTITHIPELPSAGRMKAVLNGSDFDIVAGRFYSNYHFLCHYTHSGMDGVMMSSVSRGDVPGIEKPSESSLFFQHSIVKPSIFCSWVAMLTVATLFLDEFRSDSNLMAKLSCAWSSHCTNGDLLGVWIWDKWAKQKFNLIELQTT